jgi:dienelactone hydrolase
VPNVLGLTQLLAAQARVAGSLVAGGDPPLAGRALRSLLPEPEIEEVVVAGCPTTTVRPGRGDGPWPALVLFPGVTRLGRFHPALQRVGRGLAATGHLVAIVEPPGLSAGMLTPRLVAQARAAVLEVADGPDARGGGVGLLGVSAGGTTALLCAQAPELAGRIAAVTVLAPCCDIEQAVRVVTTGFVREGVQLRAFEAGELFPLVVARSLAGCLPSGPGRDTLVDHLLSLPEYGPSPLGSVRSWRADDVEASARPVLAVLANTDPELFDDLYGRLPEEQRDALHGLSAVDGASSIEAPVEVVVAKEDKYIPRADADAFVSRCPSARLTVLASLAHAVPALALQAAPDLLRLDGVLVRFLAAVRAASYSRR